MAKNHSKNKSQFIDLSLRSEEVAELMGRVPHWMLRWGNTIFLLVFILFVLVSYWVQYPEIIRSSVILSTENLPVPLSAQRPGRIKELLVSDQAMVKAGEILLILENPAQEEEIQSLQEQYKAFSQQEGMQIAARTWQESPLLFNLGDVQNSYSNFRKALSEYQDFYQQDYQQAEIRRLNNLINSQSQLIEVSKKSVRLSNDQLRLAREQHLRDSKLYQQKVISQLSFQESQRAYLQAQSNHETIRANQIQSIQQKQTLEREVQILEESYQREQQSLVQNIKQKEQDLLLAINRWEQDYLIRSPIDGFIALSQELRPRQFVEQGETILQVLPQGGAIIARTEIQADRSGKVKKGQLTRIRLADYPYREYGTLGGKVIYKSKIARNGKYQVRIALPSELKTNYGKILEFRQEMPGEAHILTQKLRLIQRIYYQFKYLFSREP